MSYATRLDSSTHLTYALVADPTPLQVSLAGADPSTADLQLVVTNQQDQPVEIKAIKLSIPVGPDPASLTDLTTAALDMQWQPKDPWDVEPPPLGAGSNVYTLLPSDAGSGQLAAGDSIVLTFAVIPINESLGTTVLSVSEITSMGDGAVSYALAKFPYGFSFANLRVTDPQTGAVVSQVGHGSPIRLAWEGSVTDPAAYKILYSTAAGQQPGTVTTVNQWDLAQVFQDTVFNVQVTVNDDSGQPVAHTLTTSVAVAKPDLSVTSIDLGGQDLAGELATMAQSLVPKGTIAMWSGSPSAVPAGWALCDGTNGTPNLVNQFILGAGSGSTDPQPAATGGSASHSHTATAGVSIAEAGAHTHGVPSEWYSNTASSGGGRAIVDRGHTEVRGAQTQTAGTHSHTATASVSVGETTTFPPWYALCFIVKQV